MKTADLKIRQQRLIKKLIVWLIENKTALTSMKNPDSLSSPFGSLHSIKVALNRGTWHQWRSCHQFKHTFKMYEMQEQTTNLHGDDFCAPMFGRQWGDFTSNTRQSGKHETLPEKNILWRRSWNNGLLSVVNMWSLESHNGVFNHF